MAELVAVGYDDETIAAMAAHEARAAGDGLAIDPDAMAVLVRDGDGNFIVQTIHHPVTASATWGLLWQLLFGSLFFVPVLGVSVGPGLADLMAKVGDVGMGGAFEDQVREMVQPGTSALFLVTADAARPETDEALGQFGGRVLTASLSKRGTQDLQDQLHGASAVSPSRRRFKPWSASP